MFSSVNYLTLCVILLLYAIKTCKPEQIAPSLVMYSPGAPEYSEVVVRRPGDDLVLVCELRGDSPPRGHVWNYVPGNGSLAEHRPFVTSPPWSVATLASNLSLVAVGRSDEGHYVCSAPPFSASKYVLVQPAVSKVCARSAFGCGARCVLVDHVCDGREDCLHGEDEDPRLCPPLVCSRPDRLNCSSGRCIPEAACCRDQSPLCSQPACCNEHPRYSRLEGYVDVEYPPLYEDRRAPDDYPFIQSTIYTVTACALIFMIAVVLLVSAICKMHMKRAALRSYATAEAATRHHYTLHYAQAARFPPCYEASRLLDQSPPSPPLSPAAQSLPPCGSTPEACPSERAPFGLARLSALLSSRYTQVPTQCTDVEMSVRSCVRSPSLDNYRSPTYCLDSLASPQLDPLDPLGTPLDPAGGPQLNYTTELFTRRRNTLERVMEQIDRQRLTLQLGRFQLSLPRLGRSSPTRRADTPRGAGRDTPGGAGRDTPRGAGRDTRLAGHDTYTLNGRTILLGDYPPAAPPPYNDAMRYKQYGPPPEYLSREGLDQPRRREDEARTNVEMPPCYDDLSTVANNGNGNVTENAISLSNDVYVENIDSEYASNVNNNVTNDNGNSVVDNDTNGTDNVINNGIDNVTNNGSDNVFNNGTNNVANNGISINNGNESVIETLNSVIDNLPAIDSDVNAN